MTILELPLLNATFWFPFSNLEHCCLYIFTKCLKRVNMCYISENSTWNVLPFNWSSYSTGPPTQMILPFNWSQNSGQFVDDASWGSLDAIFWAAPNIKILKETQQKSLVSNLICLFWRWEDTSVLKTVWSQSQFVFAPKASNSLLIYGPLETFNR